MKKIGITLRVENVPNYAERRDCLDQKWNNIIFNLGCLPVLLPNVEPSYVKTIIQEMALDAIILSGGNSISVSGIDQQDIAPERDKFEHALIYESISQNIPMIGICRGMQVLNMYFGGELSKVNKHVGTRHSIKANEDFNNLVPEDVNSYHNFCISNNQIGDGFIAFANDIDGYVEGFIHKTHKLAGIMWHPEREEQMLESDIQLLKKVLL